MSSELAVGLNAAGWTFLGITWGTIVFLVVYCLVKLHAHPNPSNPDEPTEEAESARSLPE